MSQNSDIHFYIYNCSKYVKVCVFEQLKLVYKEIGHNTYSFGAYMYLYSSGLSHIYVDIKKEIID